MNKKRFWFVLLCLGCLVLAYWGQAVMASGSGWDAEYFNNEWFGGNPVLTRNDPAIDFNWHQGAPHPSLPADKFSVRWRTQLQVPSAGRYRFYAKGDDRIKLYVDGNQVLSIASPGENSAELSLTAGVHPVYVQYIEYSKESSIKVAITRLDSTQPTPTRPTTNPTVNPTTNPNAPTVYSFTMEPARVMPDQRTTITLRWQTNASKVALYYIDAKGNRNVVGFHDTANGSQIYITDNPDWITHFVLEATTGNRTTQKIVSVLCSSSAWFFSRGLEECPSNVAQSEAMASQTFEHGLMIWRKNVGIWVIYNSPQGWKIQADTWNEGMPEDSNPSLTPPAGYYKPIRGFGKVWQNNEIRGLLGWATSRESSYMGFVQYLDRSNTRTVYLSGNNSMVYALMPSGQQWGSFRLGDAPVKPNNPSVATPTPVSSSIYLGNWSACYYTNQWLGEAGQYCTTDARINFDWRANSPYSTHNIPADNFSVRWKQKLTLLAPQKYRVEMSADDVMSFFINRQLTMDVKHNEGTKSFEITLQRGDHFLNVEFKEYAGQARAYFNMVPVP